MERTYTIEQIKAAVHHDNPITKAALICIVEATYQIALGDGKTESDAAQAAKDALFERLDRMVERA
jgi:hypothetical protein